MKRIFSISIYLKSVVFALLLVAVYCSPVRAAIAEPTGEVKANVTIGAIVATTVCPQYSTVSLNVAEVLADVTQKATLTIVTKDCNEIPVPGTRINIISNRGAIDSIEQVDADGNILRRGDGLGTEGVTDSNGYAIFNLSSLIPGEALFSARADDQLLLGQVKVTFFAPPISKNITISVEVPKVISPNGKIILFRPKDQELDQQRLVTMGMELRLPFWLLLVVVAVASITIILAIATAILLLRIAYLQKKTFLELETEVGIVQNEQEEIEKIIDKE